VGRQETRAGRAGILGEMVGGRSIALASLEERPAEAAADQKSAHLSGIKSNLTLPLAVGGEPPVGALAFNTTRVERNWPDAVVKRLELVTQVFTNALARRRHELTLRESEVIEHGADPPGARDQALAHQGANGRGQGAGTQPLDPLQPHEEAGHPAARAGGGRPA